MLRASDADREAVTTRLHEAAVEGRLEPDELEERLHLALRARTYGELRRLVADLPAAPAPWHRRRSRSFAPLAFAIALRVAVALAVVVVAVVVIAATAMWWLAWLVVWMVLSGRRHGAARPAWRPPRARRI